MYYTVYYIFQYFLAQAYDPRIGAAKQVKWEQNQKMVALKKATDVMPEATNVYDKLKTSLDSATAVYESASAHLRKRDKMHATAYDGIPIVSSHFIHNVLSFFLILFFLIEIKK